MRLLYMRRRVPKGTGFVSITQAVISEIGAPGAPDGSAANEELIGRSDIHEAWIIYNTPGNTFVLLLKR